MGRYVLSRQSIHVYDYLCEDGYIIFNIFRFQLLGILGFELTVIIHNIFDHFLVTKTLNIIFFKGMFRILLQALRESLPSKLQVLSN